MIIQVRETPDYLILLEGRVNNHDTFVDQTRTVFIERNSRLGNFIKELFVKLPNIYYTVLFDCIYRELYNANGDIYTRDAGKYDTKN